MITLGPKPPTTLAVGGLFRLLTNPRTLGATDATSSPRRARSIKERLAAMAPRTITPGLRALDPYTPIGHTSWGAIFPAGGGRASARGVDILVGDDEGDDPDFDDDDDRDEDDEPDDRAAERQREQDRRDAARGWQKPKPKPKQRREEPDEDDEDDLDEDDEEPEAHDDRRRSRGRRGSVEDTEGWTPPSREQWEKVTDAVKRNNDENFKRRYVAKAMKRLGIEDEDGFRAFMLDRGLDPDSGERIGGDEDGDSGGDADLFEQSQDDAGPTTKQRSRAEVIAERRRHEERGRTQAERQYKPGMALFAAEAELRAAGFTGKDISLAIRMIDPEEIEVDFDEHGWPVVHGLTEQVANIKEGIPEWFRQPRPTRDRDEDADERAARRPVSRRRVGGVREVDGGERRRPAEKPVGWLQRADAQMMGRRL